MVTGARDLGFNPRAGQVVCSGKRLATAATSLYCLGAVSCGDGPTTRYTLRCNTASMIRCNEELKIQLLIRFVKNEKMVQAFHADVNEGWSLIIREWSTLKCFIGEWCCFPGGCHLPST